MNLTNNKTPKYSPELCYVVDGVEYIRVCEECINCPNTDNQWTNCKCYNKLTGKTVDCPEFCVENGEELSVTFHDKTTWLSGTGDTTGSLSLLNNPSVFPITIEGYVMQSQSAVPLPSPVTVTNALEYAQWTIDVGFIDSEGNTLTTSNWIMPTDTTLAFDSIFPDSNSGYPASFSTQPCTGVEYIPCGDSENCGSFTGIIKCFEGTNPLSVEYVNSDITTDIDVAATATELTWNGGINGEPDAIESFQFILNNIDSGLEMSFVDFNGNTYTFTATSIISNSGNGNLVLGGTTSQPFAPLKVQASIISTGSNRGQASQWMSCDKQTVKWFDEQGAELTVEEIAELESCSKQAAILEGCDIDTSEPTVLGINALTGEELWRRTLDSYGLNNCCPTTVEPQICDYNVLMNEAITASVIQSITTENGILPLNYQYSWMSSIDRANFIADVEAAIPGCTVVIPSLSRFGNVFSILSSNVRIDNVNTLGGTWLFNSSCINREHDQKKTKTSGILKIEKYTYSKETVPQFWAHYFQDSVEGKEYTVLVNENNDLVMSDTEYEVKTNSEILEKAYGDVLIIGLGLNLINDKVLALKKVNSVDTLEIDQWVIDNVETKTNVLKGDYKTYKFNKKYDVIYFDAYDSFIQEHLEKALKKGGTLLSWNP